MKKSKQQDDDEASSQPTPRSHTQTGAPVPMLWELGLMFYIITAFHQCGLLRIYFEKSCAFLRRSEEDLLGKSNLEINSNLKSIQVPTTEKCSAMQQGWLLK